MTATPPKHEVKFTAVYERLTNSFLDLCQEKDRSFIPTIIEVGGAGSSKSHSIAQFILLCLTTYRGLRIAIGRKTFPSHRISGMALVLDLLHQWNMYNEEQHEKTSHLYRYNGNQVFFFSMGEGESGREKIKSFDANLIWLEEATEFEYEEYAQLKLRLRHPEPADFRNTIILSLNPVDEFSWVNKKLIESKLTSVIVHHSTQENNDFLPKAYRESLKRLIDENPNYYRIYCLGLWGHLENLIYQNWQIVDKLPEKPVAWAYGLDFGYVHPAALIRVMITGDITYWHECLYASNFLNSDIIERLTHLERAPIYADSARPDAIEEISRAGYEIYPANKDVKTGLDVCKRRKIGVSRQSVNLLKEIQSYCYKKDKDGNLTEDPVKFRDDGMDAGRYGTLGLVTRFNAFSLVGAPGGLGEAVSLMVIR